MRVGRTNWWILLVVIRQRTCNQKISSTLICLHERLTVFNPTGGIRAMNTLFLQRWLRIVWQFKHQVYLQNEYFHLVQTWWLLVDVQWKEKQLRWLSFLNLIFKNIIILRRETVRDLMRRQPYTLPLLNSKYAPDCKFEIDGIACLMLWHKSR